MIYHLDTFPGREITIDQKKHLYFGGTSYLGLQTDDDFRRIFIQNIALYGTNYGASRNSNVQLMIYEAAEKFLAHWVGSEAALTLSSGYLAAQLVCSHFNREQYRMFHAPNSHSALFLPTTGKTRPKSYVTYTSLNIALREHLETHPGITPVVCLDSIDFSGNNYPDFEGLLALPLDEIIVLADDSHGIGIAGLDGSGVYSLLAGLMPKEVVVCCSLGKALAIQSGAIFGTKSRLEQIQGTELFGGASPAAPALMATLIAGKDLFAHKKRILDSHIGLLDTQVKKWGSISRVPDHPCYSYADPALTKHLEANKIIVTDFSYPASDGPHTSRIVLSASHLTADIVLLAKALNGYFSP